MTFKKGDKVLAGEHPRRYTVLKADENLIEIDMKTIIDGRVILESMLVSNESLRLAPEQVFEETVREMRDLQKEYFRTRDVEILNKAKSAEKRLDALLADVDSVQGRLL